EEFGIAAYHLLQVRSAQRRLEELEQGALAREKGRRGWDAHHFSYEEHAFAGWPLLRGPFEQPQAIDRRRSLLIPQPRPGVEHESRRLRLQIHPLVALLADRLAVDDVPAPAGVRDLRVAEADERGVPFR